MKHFYLKKLFAFKLSCVSVLLLSSCTSIPFQTQMAATDQGEPIELSQTLSKSDQKYPEQLKIAENYLRNGQLSAAESILDEMNTGEMQASELKAQYWYLKAQVAAQKHDWESGLYFVTKALNQKNKLPEQEIVLYKLASELYHVTNQPIKKAEALTKLNSIQPSEAITNSIWYTLQPIHQNKIREQIKKTTHREFKGWLELSYISKKYTDKPKELEKKVQRWQKNYPNHSQNTKLPDDIRRGINIKVYKPKKIGVLLPLTGKAQKYAKAIQHGMLASGMSKKNKKINLVFYDSNEAVEAAYNQAKSENCDFIVGPLLKENVDEISSIRSEVIPQLMLNKPDSVINDPDRYYFSLSPTEEATQAANYLHQEGMINPLLISSTHSTTMAMADAFSQQWEQLKGIAPRQSYYSSKEAIKLEVSRALDVEASKNRIRAIKNHFGAVLKADFRSRRDIDAIYLITFKNEIRLLKPFVEVNTSVSAPVIPTFSSHRSHVKSTNGQYPRELNRLRINDMPWLLRTSKELMNIESWSNQEKRLYTMGYDSINIIDKLAQMKASQSNYFNGRTGKITIDNEGVLHRQQAWAQFKNGQLSPL